MTHLDIYARMSRFDRKAGIKTLLTLGGIIVIAFIGAALVPQSWVDSFVADSSPNIMSLHLHEDSRFMLVPFMLSSPILVGALVLGIITAAESRSYLGAGVTRRAKWLDDRRTNLGGSIVLMGTLIISIGIALMLDGASGFDTAEALKAGGLFFLTLIASYEVGQVFSLLYTRYNWIPATAATIVYSAGLVVALNTEWPGVDVEWPWFRILVAIIIAVVTLPATYAMLTTLPMRRRG